MRLFREEDGDEKIKVPTNLGPTLDAIGRRILDKNYDAEVSNPRAVALKGFVLCYIRTYREDFEKVDGRGYRYVGGDEGDD